MLDLCSSRIQLAIDLATATSVAGAAVAFIINSRRQAKNAREQYLKGSLAGHLSSFSGRMLKLHVIADQIGMLASRREEVPKELYKDYTDEVRRIFEELQISNKVWFGDKRSVPKSLTRAREEAENVERLLKDQLDILYFGPKTGESLNLFKINSEIQDAMSRMLRHALL
jgi:hypothetical protein